MGTLRTLEPRLHSPPVTRADLEPLRPGRRQRLVLEPRLHTEPFGTEPYYDEELDVMTLEPHRIAIGWLFATLEHGVAAALGLRFASDHPIWYESVEGQQRVLRPDAILLRKDAELRRATSRQVLFALEVVSTNDRRKELKDTVSMKSINELNEVPEFALFYPDLEDSRCFEMFRLEETTHAYAPVHVVDGRFVSVAIP
ncbi:MAG: Uma2 family endonuclease, partial [Deltaproteobacteria bacterium]|nr:Uma2 family endonuclease [Deltaproteobacteria bacterium]